MAKVVKKAPSKTNVELNRWCIEMAMRWPTVTYYGNQGGSYGGFPAKTEADADVIGRANKIMTWVKTQH